VSDRSKELRRQRELSSAQLAWIDREIAAEERKPGAAPGPRRRPSCPPAPRPTTGTPRRSSRNTARPPVSIARQTKLGCILYFAAAMGLIALAVLALYLLVKNSRAH
jgi:hypothetical protein